MKKIRKLFAVLAAVMLTCSLSVTAKAEGDGNNTEATTTTYSITITNDSDNTNISIAGKTFNAYKIFDVTNGQVQSDGTVPHSYTISSESPWFEAVLLYMGSGSAMNTAATADSATGIYIGNGLKLTPTAADASVYVVEELETVYSYTIGEGESAKTVYTSDKIKFYESYSNGQLTTAYTIPEGTTIDDSNYVVVADSLDARSFADALTKYLNLSSPDITPDKTVTAAAETETVTIALTEPGYYLVTGSGATTEETPQEVVGASGLWTTNPTAEFEIKAKAPTLDKVIIHADSYVPGNDDLERGNGTGVNVGDVVTFEVTAKVPDMRGYSEYKYVFTDTLSSGLTLNINEDNESETFTVTVDGDEVELHIAASAPSAATVLSGNTYYIDGQTFYISLDLLTPFNNGEIEKGDEIVITYSATLNNNALTTDKETNTVNLTYSRDPYGTLENKYATTPDEKVYVYDFDIEINKYAAGSETKLSDATFILYKVIYAYNIGNEEVPNLVYSDDAAVDANTKFYSDTNLSDEITEPVSLTAGSAGTRLELYYHEDDNNNNNITWVLDLNEATAKTTNTEGFAAFKGLDSGTYYLRETEAPAGYNKLTQDVEVVITAAYGNDGQIDVDNSTVTKSTDSSKYYLTKNIENNTGAELPSTGGIGTTMFYVAGSIMTLGAIVLLITRKRMHSSEE